ncbi:hypothetical protein PV403_19925 [Paenibacillus sp. GYB006]|uniref:hypothetical protein n=1 Tax=Paenibacillus sp. GYB006 TaxID=2994394 RepID=UPI002F969D38
MLKEQTTSEIIRLVDLYKQLNQEEHFKQAGDVYKKLTNHVFKKLTRDIQVFKSVVDDLLFYKQNPSVQIEIATEAIGMGYRKEEAIKILEDYAQWTSEMTFQNEKGMLCNIAQKRLHNLLGYKLNYDENNTWVRSNNQEITPIYKQFFEQRSNNSIDVTSKSVGYTNKEGQQFIVSEILNIYPDDADCFLLFCSTKDATNSYILISSDGELLHVYDEFLHMETFHNDRSIVSIQTTTDERGMYGVVKRDGEIYIPIKYNEVRRLSDFFFMCIRSSDQGDLYHQSGQLILENISIYELVVNKGASFIYQNILYDETGQTIVDLISVGSNWEASDSLGEYVGFDSANDVIYINDNGRVLPVKEIDFETHFMLDKEGEVYILHHDGISTLRMDGKDYILSGNYYSIIKRFSNDHFILRDGSADGSFLWVDRKKRKLQLFSAVQCTNYGYWFAKESYTDSNLSSFWLIMNSKGDRCITEKHQIINIYEDHENDAWIIENVELEEFFFLALKKKVIKKEIVVKNFIKKNVIKK